MICLKSFTSLSYTCFWVTVCLTLLSSGVGVRGASAESDAPPPRIRKLECDGSPGGDVRGLVVDPHDAERFYFGTLDGQVYVSSDAAKSCSCFTTSTFRDCLSITSSLIHGTQTPCTSARTVQRAGWFF